MPNNELHTWKNAPAPAQLPATRRPSPNAANKLPWLMPSIDKKRRATAKMQAWLAMSGLRPCVGCLASSRVVWNWETQVTTGPRPSSNQRHYCQSGQRPRLRRRLDCCPAVATRKQTLRRSTLRLRKHTLARMALIQEFQINAISISLQATLSQFWES